MTVGSWNVRTLQDNSNNPERRTAVISKILKKYNIDIVALSETRFPGNGQLQEDDYTFFWSGRPEDDHRTAGVGFAIRNDIASKLEEIPVGINERLMYLRIALQKDKHATFVSAYAPTMTNTDEVKERFYEDLQQILAKVPLKDDIVLLGDFNARVGNDTQAWPKVLGRHLPGKNNSNGLLLLSLCSEHKLVITNSVFQQPNKWKGTWRHPRSKDWHTLDYVITRQRDLKSVKITRAHCGTECWSDHRLLRSKLKISLSRKPRKSRPKVTKKLNCEKLNQPIEAAKFSESLDKALEKCSITNDVEESWKSLRDTLYETSADLLGFPKRKHQDWFDENDSETSALIESMHVSHLKYMKDKSNKRTKNQYLSKKRDVQRRLRHLKEKWWREKAQELQKASDTNNTKEFYQKLKVIYGPKSKATSPLLDTAGKTLLVDEDKILQRWVDHYSEVLNRPSSADLLTINSIPQRTIIDELDAYPTAAEVKLAIKILCRGKKPGRDGIPAEIYKVGGPGLIKKLTALLKKIWEQGSVPQDFKDASVISLFKKGKRSLCDNYRGISLLSVAGKILARIILSRVNKHLTDLVYSESQCGFRKGRGTTDMIFCLRQVQEKAREHNAPLYMAFVDLTKAFDTVPRTSLWTVLGKLGIPEKMKNIIISFHDGMQAQVIHGGKVSDTFPVNNGTKQGCVLAPLLFALYFAVMLQHALLDKGLGIPICFRPTGGLFNIRRFTAKTKVSIETLCDLLFADDCALVSHSMADLQNLMDTFSASCKAFGLTISTKKTEIVYQPPPRSNSNRHSPVKIKIENLTLKQNSKFLYLGSTITEKATLDEEIQFRIGKASSAFGNLQDRLWSSHDVSLKTKVDVYKAVVISSLLYGSETWTPYRRQIKILDAFHMRKLRSICNVTWKDRVTNHEVLTKCQIPGIEAFLLRSQLRWAGHVARMENTRLPKIMLYGQLEKYPRPEGRPLLRYKDKLKSNINTLKLGERDWERLCLERSQWRASCHQSISNFETRRLQSMVVDRHNRKCAQQSSVGTMFVCSICDKRCKSNAGLSAHMRSHNQTQDSNQQATCRICSKICKNSHGLKVHLRVHKKKS